MNSQSLPSTCMPDTVVFCQNSYDPFQDRDSVYTICDGTFPPDVLNSGYNGEAGPYPGWLVGRVGSQLRSCRIGRVGSNDL
jgi:hypothetical protein